MNAEDDALAAPESVTEQVSLLFPLFDRRECLCLLLLLDFLRLFTELFSSSRPTRPNLRYRLTPRFGSRTSESQLRWGGEVRGSMGVHS